jgi:heme exporter protein B
MLLSLDGLFRQDLEDGSLEQLLVAPAPLPLLVLAKVAAHWLQTGFCLVLLSPVGGGHVVDWMMEAVAHR